MTSTSIPAATDVSDTTRPTVELDAVPNTATVTTQPLEQTASKGGTEAEEHFVDAAEEPIADTADTHDDENRDGPPAPLPATGDAVAPTLTRTTSEAIGPDLPTPILESQPQLGVSIQFILLLASAGTRHPFQLNEKYLNKRNVTATNAEGQFDPASISVYNLKELIYRDWREDWEDKPSSPGAIRLIFFGQLLADNTSLRECKMLPNGNSHVLHISIKPQDFIDEEENAKGGKTSIRRGQSGSSGGCSCVIL